jgi:hypothetical protein
MTDQAKQRIEDLAQDEAPLSAAAAEATAGGAIYMDQSGIVGPEERVGAVGPETALKSPLLRTAKSLIAPSDIVGPEELK